MRGDTGLCMSRAATSPACSDSGLGAAAAAARAMKRLPTCCPTSRPSLRCNAPARSAPENNGAHDSAEVLPTPACPYRPRAASRRASEMLIRFGSGDARALRLALAELRDPAVAGSPDRCKELLATMTNRLFMHSRDSAEVIVAAGGVQVLAALVEHLQQLPATAQTIPMHQLSTAALTLISGNSDRGAQQITQHALPALLGALAHSDERMQSGGATVLYDLLGRPDSCRRFLEQPGALDLLVQRATEQAQSADPLADTHAIGALARLFLKSCDQEQLLACPGAVQALVQVLGSSGVPEHEQHEAARALAKLAQGCAAGAAAVLEAGAVPALVQRMRPQASGPLTVRHVCAALLGALLVWDGSRAQAAAESLAASAIQPLQLLLLGGALGSRGAGSSSQSSTSPSAAVCAASCLCSIIVSSAEGARAAQQAGVHRVVVRVLQQTKHPGLRDVALGVLAVAGTHDEQDAAAAVEAGALEQAEQLLASPYMRTQRNAAVALRQLLASWPPAERGPWVRRLRRAPQLLLQLLAGCSRSEQVQAEAAGALCALITPAEPVTARRIIASPRAVQQLAQLMSSQDATVRRAAMYCLVNTIVRTKARGAAVCAAAGVAPLLVQQVLAGAAAVQQQPGADAEHENDLVAALEALCALAARRDPGVSQQLVGAGAVEALQQLCQGAQASEDGSTSNTSSTAAAAAAAAAALAGCLALVPAAFARLLVVRSIMARALVAGRARALLLEAAAGPVAAGPAAAAGAGAVQQGPAAAGQPPQQQRRPRCCARCGERGTRAQRLRLCGACRAVRYCSAECQRAHWPEHWRECVASRAPPQGEA